MREGVTLNSGCGKNGKWTLSASLIVLLASAAWCEVSPGRALEIVSRLTSDRNRDSQTWSRDRSALKAEARLNWPQYSEAEKRLLEPLLSRPTESDLPESLVSPSARFKIHYTLEGGDAATPEFIAEVAAAFDQVYDFEINRLGYRPPPSDFGLAGPEYDVYVHDIPDYGATISEYPSGESDRPSGYSSWTEIDNDFTHTPTKGIPAMKVTAAHEFFHMIQVGYRDWDLYPIDTRFLYEMCSTWMEDQAYPEVNDYFYSLSAYFDAADLPFNTFNGMHEYGISVFNFMLEKKYGPGVIRRIWEIHTRESNPFSALDRALSENGSQLSIEFADFSIWNLFTADNADTARFYTEGDHYPGIRATDSYPFNQTLTFSGHSPPLSSKFYRIHAQTAGTLTVWPSFESPFLWICSAVVLPPDNAGYWEMTSGNQSQSLSLSSRSAEVWLVPTYTQWPSGNNGQRRDDFQITLNHIPAPSRDQAIVGVAPNPYLPDRHSYAEVRFYLNQPSERVEVLITDENGRRIRRARMGRVAEGYNAFRWDGLDGQGYEAASGVYLFYIESDQILGPAKLALIR